MYYIVTAPNCSYCTKAKELLSSEEHPYKSYDLTDLPFLLTLFKDVGYKTVPQIWYNSEYVGGYKELYEKLWDSHK